MRRASTRRVAAVLGALGVLLAACSGDGSSGGPSTSAGGGPASTAVTQPTGPTTAPASTVPGTAPVASAVDTLPVGVVWDYAKQDALAPLLEQLRGGATWYELEWCQTQPDPAQPVNWARADKNLGRAQAVGITTMLRLRVGSCWATGGEKLDPGRGGLGYSVSAMPVDPEAYQAWVHSVVERYGPQGVTTYAIENEPNGDAFWRGSAEEYEELVRLGAEAVKEADPDATVTDGGLSSTAWGVAMAADALEAGRDQEAVELYTRYYERRFSRRARDFPPADDADELRRALQTEQSRRNLEMAEATFRLARDGVIDAFQLHLYERWTNVSDLLSYLRSELPAGMPIDVWEAGLFWPDFDGSDEEIAAETAQLLYTLLGNGASRVIFLPMQSNTLSRGEEIRFGLVDESFQPRPGFEVLAGLAEFARQGPVTWQDLVSADGARTVVGVGPEGAQGLAWSNERPIPLAAPEVTVSSLDGARSAPATGVELTDDPVLVTAPSVDDLTALLG